MTIGHQSLTFFDVIKLGIMAWIVLYLIANALSAGWHAGRKK